MKAIILAGGLGTRMGEETYLKPKPMIEIGGKPIIWHIMKVYSCYNIDEFVICSGYKGDVIENYFKENEESWKINVVDTGLETNTGGRLKRVQKFVEKNSFCFTYGDSLNNVNIQKLIEFHQKKGKLATVTTSHPPEKYGVFGLNGDNVMSFEEKPDRKDEWVNAGFFVLEPEIFDFIEGDYTVWEEEPMKEIIKKNQMVAYKHEDFYQSMDTSKDQKILEDLWNKNKAKWKIWK